LKYPPNNKEVSKTLKELPVFFENGIAMILCQHRKGEIYENDKS